MVRGGKQDPAFRTKPLIAKELIERALAREIPFRAVVADSLYGEHRQLKAELKRCGVGFVLALKPSHAWRHYAHEIGTVCEAAQAVGAHWKSAEEPGAWSAASYFLLGRGYRYCARSCLAAVSRKECRPRA